MIRLRIFIQHQSTLVGICIPQCSPITDPCAPDGNANEYLVLRVAEKVKEVYLEMPQTSQLTVDAWCAILYHCPELTSSASQRDISDALNVLFIFTTTIDTCRAESPHHEFHCALTCQLLQFVLLWVETEKLETPTDSSKSTPQSLCWKNMRE